MNWKQRLFKPKWQNKNADIRLDAVSSEQDPRLIASLFEIAEKDADHRVRSAAIRRLHQLENILKLYSTEQEVTVKTLLEQRIRQLAAATNEGRPPLELRLKVVGMTNNRDLIEHLARNAPEIELRKAALARVTRQGVLGDCCIEDEDAGIRRQAAELIHQHTTLKRVIEALRKRDKALHSNLQQRLHEELLEKGDPGAVEAEALGICTSLEKLALGNDAGEMAETKSLFRKWDAIAKRVSPDMTLRFERVHRRLTEPQPEETPASAAENVSIEVPPAAPRAPESTPPGESSQAPSGELAAHVAIIREYHTKNEAHPVPSKLSKLRSKLDEEWQKCQPPQPEDRVNHDTAAKLLAELDATLEHRNQQEKADQEQAGELLNRLETALERGELQNALEIRSELQTITRPHGRHKAWKPVQGKLSVLHGRIRELRDWHHWSNNKIRKRLIAEMEILPSADLHPDALLDRIKSLQTEWKQLEDSEQIPGEKRFMAAPWMWRKFNDAGHKAFDTAKPFLDKRSEIHAKHVAAVDAFCSEFESLLEAVPTDWSTLGKTLKAGRSKMNELSGLPARQRSKVARKLKKMLARGNDLMQDRYEAVEKEKMKLIRVASQLAHVTDQADAISQAKSLQSDWKAAGSLWRRREQELWTQFRQHLDPLFNELKEAQESQRAAEDERLKAQKVLCEEMAGILASEEPLIDLHGKVQGLQDSWRDIAHPDRRLREKFQAMIDDYQKKVDAQETQAMQAIQHRWWLKSALLHELLVNGRTKKGTLSKKALASIASGWPKDTSGDEFESDLDRLQGALLDGDEPPQEDETVPDLVARARLLCISLEFIAGLPSPEEDRERRMKYQVDRLAHSMAGDAARQSVEEEALEAEKTWLSMYRLPDEEHKSFKARVEAALSAINENN